MEGGLLQEFNCKAETCDSMCVCVCVCVCVTKKLLFIKKSSINSINYLEL